MSVKPLICDWDWNNNKKKNVPDWCSSEAVDFEAMKIDFPVEIQREETVERCLQDREEEEAFFFFLAKEAIFGREIGEMCVFLPPYELSSFPPFVTEN